MKKLLIMLMLALFSITGVVNAQTAAPASQHAKKDGTPDKRFKENKMAKPVHMKKDGTPDKRFKENNKKS